MCLDETERFFALFKVKFRIDTLLSQDFFRVAVFMFTLEMDGKCKQNIHIITFTVTNIYILGQINAMNGRDSAKNAPKQFFFGVGIFKEQLEDKNCIRIRNIKIRFFFSE